MRPVQVCKDLGIPEGTFWGWMEQYQELGEKGFIGSGNKQDAEKEIANLQKALADARLERDILKKALAIFSKQ